MTATTYNAASQPLAVSLKLGDSDNYAYDPNTGRMTNYTLTVGATPKSMVGGLTWNANGTLSKLTITDGFNASGTQTCKYGDPSSSVPGYDDLSRLISANCGAIWSQTFSYDPFGNITKSGSVAWMPGYNQSTNRYTLGGTSYDADGNLLNDTFHTYIWDAYGKPASVDSSACGTNGTCFTYDALGQLVEKNIAGVYSQIEYSPVGKVAVLNSGGTWVRGYVPLPGGEVLAPNPDTFWHMDWLGSARLASSAPNRTITFDRAFAPFGELYNTVTGGTSNPDFAGLTRDAISDEGDTPNREYHQKQGRWISPDPGGLDAVDAANPQSWNQYAYVLNNPFVATDPLGLDCVYLKDSGDEISSVDTNSNREECEGPRNHPNGGFWVDGTVTHVTLYTNSDDVLLSGLQRDNQGYLNIQTGSAYTNVRDSIDSQIYDAPVGTTVDAIHQQQLQQFPHIGPQDPLDVAIGCGGNAAVSIVKDVSGLKLLDDTASALAAGSFKPLLNPSDAAGVTEHGADLAAENAAARGAVRSLSRKLGSKISVKAGGKLLKGAGKKAGWIGVGIAVADAGSEFVDCVQ